MQIEGRTFLPHGVVEPCSIVIRDGTIESVTPLGSSLGGARPDRLLVPAFVDVHVHGGGGHDFADGDPSSVKRILETHGRGGTSALAATIVSSPPEATLRAIESIVAAEEAADGAEICAIHLEGPYLNADKCGAQNPAALRRPDPEEVETWIEAAHGLPLRITLAPELPGALELIQRFPGIRFSLGHTKAAYDLCLEAFADGCQSVTHLFNAMPPLHHREPGLVGAAMVTPEVWMELIPDGHHIHPSILQVMSRKFGSRTLLVTDAMSATGSTNAEATLGGLRVRIADGAARLEDGTLAGSVITMRDGLATMVERAGVPIEQVLPLMTSHPAAALGIGHRKGSIAAGLDADLLELDARLNITRRIVRGREA